LFAPYIIFGVFRANQHGDKGCEEKNELGVVENVLEDASVALTTTDRIISCLGDYLGWVSVYSERKKHVRLSNHHNFPEKLINHYINSFLIDEKKKGENGVDNAVMSLNAYYNWLADAQLTTLKSIRTFPKQRTKLDRALRKKIILSTLWQDYALNITENRQAY
jgi:hypothetical protein